MGPGQEQYYYYCIFYRLLCNVYFWQVQEEQIHLVLPGTAVARKMGFPEVIMPGKWTISTRGLVFFLSPCTEHALLLEILTFFFAWRLYN